MDSSMHVETIRQRKYLPTLAELIDRLSIVQLKSVFILEHRDEYLQEMEAIEHDIDLILDEKFDGQGYRLHAADVRAIVVVMLANRYIWENEARARTGNSEQDHLLKLTHSINGVRNTAKNRISIAADDRVDLKIDCFAADLVEKFGNWRIWD